MNFNWLQRAVKPFDIVIGIAAIFIFSQMDFDHLLLVDEIFIATFAIWFVLLLVRCYIYYRKGQGS